MWNLEDALKVIREECKKHNECVTCSLRGVGGIKCQIQNQPPEDWKLKSDSDLDIPPRSFAEV